MLRRTLIYAVAALLFLLVMRMGTMAQTQHKHALSARSVPAYRSTLLREQFAPTLSPRDFPGNPLAQNAYATAAQIEPLLYQLPCYCHCDREIGHSSLLRCFQDRHAADCGACKMEEYYAYQQSRKGETASQIRQQIIGGAWKHVNLSKWKTPLAGLDTTGQ